MIRRLMFDPQATEDLINQRRYLVDQDLRDAADELELTIVTYLARTIATFPEIGHPSGRTDVLECIIPHTRWVAWYLHTDDELYVVDLWHTSEDRPLPPQ